MGDSVGLSKGSGLAGYGVGENKIRLSVKRHPWFSVGRRCGCHSLGWRWANPQASATHRPDRPSDGGDQGRTRDSRHGDPAPWGAGSGAGYRMGSRPEWPWPVGGVVPGVDACRPREAKREKNRKKGLALECQPLGNNRWISAS